MDDIYLADDWLLIRHLQPEAIPALAKAASASPVWEDVVPGIASLSLKFDPAALTGEQARDAADTLLRTPTEQLDPVILEPVILHICYDPEFGLDQQRIAETLGLSTEALPQWHQAQSWSVAMLGFLPGFAYLVSDTSYPPITRLSDPRQSVTQGSVGLSGNQCGLYASSGPGGWPLLGRVVEPLFDPQSEPPARLAAGQRVHFKTVSRAEFDALKGAGR